MKNQKLFKTNAAVSIILIIGFLLTSIFSYKANYKASLDNIEQMSALTSEGIYYQMRTNFAKPVNVSYFMISEDGTHYFWMGIESDTFLSSEDKCIHMFTYRKNIDEDKKRALQVTKRAETDEMTGFYTRTAAAMCLGIWPLKSLQQLYEGISVKMIFWGGSAAMNLRHLFRQRIWRLWRQRQRRFL